jgi:hypothetical protein
MDLRGGWNDGGAGALARMVAVKVGASLPLPPSRSRSTPWSRSSGVMAVVRALQLPVLPIEAK